MCSKAIPLVQPYSQYQLLQRLQEKHPHIHVLAYLDDVFLIGPLGQTIPALEDMKASFSNVGLTTANEKCEIYISEDVDSCSTPVTIPISTSGTSILGVPIGDPENISSFCLEFAKSGKCLCDQLLNLDDPQEGMLLLRYCHVSRVNYLNRSVSPNHLQADASYHDHLTQSTFKQLVRCHDLDYKQWLQVTLPIKYGGFGMTSMAQSCGAAFVASWTQSIIDLPTLFPNLQPSITRLCSLTTMTEGIGHHLSQARHFQAS